MSIKNYSKFVEDHINQADYILIGLGAGMSAAAGLDYEDEKLFKKWFPQLYDKGYRTINEARSAYWTLTEDNARSYYAYWATHIYHIRYETKALLLYLKLKDLLKNIDDENYFIVSTNVDGQLEKSKFNLDRVYAPQGDYAYFQCDQHQDIYYNEQMVKKMLKHLDTDNFEIRAEDIPRCPISHSLLTLNVRKDNLFVGDTYLKNFYEYQTFIRKIKTGKVLILELGVGYNTPTIIRYPFERLTNYYQDVTFIRVNQQFATVPDEIKSKSILIKKDISSIIL